MKNISLDENALLRLTVELVGHDGAPASPRYAQAAVESYLERVSMVYRHLKGLALEAEVGGGPQNLG